MSISAAKEALRRSKAALRKGDKDLARQWAEKAASLAPQLEAPWLLLAATSRPQLSIHYLKRALAINPNSAAAQKGIRWAKKRLEATKKQEADRKKPGLESKTPIRAQAGHDTHSGTGEARSDKNGGILHIHTRIEETQPKRAFARVKTTPREETQPSKAIAPKTRAPFWRQSLPALLLTVLLVSLVWALMPRISSFAAAMQAAPTATFSQEHWGEGEMPKPTYTPSPTATFTSTPTPTITPTPTSTSTPVPPTRTPRPANTAIPVVVEDDPIPTGGKYVLVDISEQRLYAYQGNTLVYSFVASTGMNNATAAGHFSVLNKIPNAYGATWDIWMPYWLGIYWAGSMQNGIHALPIMSNGATLWAGYLGTPISYGCVVLGSYEAQLLYHWVDIGTPVDIQW